MEKVIKVAKVQKERAAPMQPVAKEHKRGNGSEPGQKWKDPRAKA